jgi:GAF domain-containing protein
MRARLRNFFQPPVFDDFERNIRAQNIHTILLGTFILAILYLLYSLFFPPYNQAFIALVFMVILFGLYFLLRYKYLEVVSVIFTSLLWLAVLLTVSLYGGVRDTGFSIFATVIVIAGLSMGITASIIYTAITIFAGLLLIILENRGLLPPYVPVSTTSVLISQTITFITILLLLYLTIRSITSSSRKAIKDEQSIRETNIQLEQNRIELEQRTITLERRNTTYKSLTDFSRLASQAHSEDDLLGQTIQFLSKELNFDHVGIFLVDDLEEFAILVASNSDAGKSLIADRYKLMISKGELVSIFPDADYFRIQSGTQIYRVSRPSVVPGAKTNMSFPIVAGPKFIGVLNIQLQSLAPENIEKETIQTFADQFALSHQNIILLGQLQSRLSEISVLAGQAIKGSWSQIMSGGTVGYSYNRLHVLPIGEIFPKEITEQLLSRQSATYITKDENPRARLVTPIILRDEVIGTLGYEDDDPAHEWQSEEMLLLETIASRVSLAIENSRLLTESQQRAEQERSIAQVAAQMRETLDVDNVLQTAVQEIRRYLNLEQAEVRLQLASREEEQANKHSKKE